MTRIMYDAVSPGNIPLTGSTMIAGYLDGRYANLSALRARFPKEKIVEIAVFPSTPAAKGRVLDRENGDATAAQAVQWCAAYPGSNKDLTVYCNTSDWPAAKQAFVNAGITQPNWWVAHYDGIATIPAGAIAKQYATGNFDKSVVADYWPGVDAPPVSTGGTPKPDPSPHNSPITEDDMRIITYPKVAGWKGDFFFAGGVLKHIDTPAKETALKAAGVETVELSVTDFNELYSFLGVK